MSDQDLMASIKSRLGALIAQVCGASSIPPAFLAALVANESAGNPNASRYEPAIFGRIQDVVMLRKPGFSATGIKRTLGRQELMLYISPAEVVSPTTAATPTYTFSQSLKRMEFLATSWGLTQIMGWHIIEFQKSGAILGDPNGQLTFTLEILAYFAQLYQLDLTKDFPQLFTCWNAGAPDKPTFDPNYISNGLARYAIYSGLS